ncbi:MAG: hypothetical protein ACOC2N_02605 [Spirochaetota bacterium]
MNSNRILAIALLFLVILAPVSALEIGTYFELSNLDFGRNRASTATNLPGDAYLWGIRAVGSERLADQLSLNLEFASDPILRNIGYTLLTYDDEFFSIRLGPFFGILNAPATILQSGLSTTVTLFVPGIAVFSLRSDDSLGGRLVVVGDYFQEQSELSVGFFVPNAIPTVYVRSKRYTSKTTEGEMVETFTAFGLETDIFQKNIPYRAALDFAYQGVSRSFVAADTSTHSYGALVLGTDASVDFERFTISAELETSIYTFGRDDLIGEVSADRFLFRLSTGVSYRF